MQKLVLEVVTYIKEGKVIPETHLLAIEVVRMASSPTAILKHATE